MKVTRSIFIALVSLVFLTTTVVFGAKSGSPKSGGKSGSRPQFEDTGSKGRSAPDGESSDTGRGSFSEDSDRGRGSFDGGGYSGGNRGSFDGGGYDRGGNFRNAHDGTSVLPVIQNSMNQLSKSDRQQWIDSSAKILLAAGVAGTLTLSPPVLTALRSHLAWITAGGLARSSARALGFWGGMIGVVSVANADEAIEGYLDQEGMMKFLNQNDQSLQLWALENVDGLADLLEAMATQGP